MRQEFGRFSMEEGAMNATRPHSLRLQSNVLTGPTSLVIKGTNDVPVNYEESIHWWREAAQQNFAPAVYNLGVMFHTGTGVKQG